jgi:5'-phosphate synthase pdxT subunit
VCHAPKLQQQTCCRVLLLHTPPRAGQKKGGQALLGGLDICVSRNFFGADDTFRAVFIRAPAVLEAGPQVRWGACVSAPG